ncbi:hypothetical protein BH23GEM10_BH23GEM10_03940 [soil metagenome]
MPQPVLHLLLAHRTLDRWRVHEDVAPFDAADRDLANAFRHGCLAPDYGLFPGGDATLSAIAHRGRTGDLVRALFAAADSPARRAFACGWLAHVLADVAIHPLINRAAAELAGNRHSLADHISVEVGVDVYFCAGDATLRALRLVPAFDRDGFTFLVDAVRTTHDYEVSSARLVSMQRGLMRFTHAALHFATSLAHDLCWTKTGAASRRHPASALLWYTATALSPRASRVHAYLEPVRPVDWLAADTSAALDRLLPALDDRLENLEGLPDHDLETGRLTRQAPDRSAA